MGMPSYEEARKLAGWQPPLGAVSIYLRLDPGDRGEAWRTELGNGLAAVGERAGGLDHGAAAALRATLARIGERFANHERALPRGEVGFVEVAEKAGEEHWWTVHLSPDGAACVSHGERPLVAPLFGLIERAAPRGVALLSAERVRLLDRRPGHLEQLHDWELTVFSDDWRERKAQQAADPARAQGVSASGHDRYDGRLEQNRHRFLGECGGLAAPIAAERGWRQLLVFGAAEQAREFERGIAAAGLDVAAGGDADLISEPAGRVAAAVDAACERLEAERERALVERVLEEARGGTRGTAGRQETEAALAEARVERLVVDGAGAEGCEALVRTALASGAGIASVSGEAADLLAPVDGIAALLRY